MPIYEFACTQCHREFELLVRSQDWKGTRCPKCGSSRITKRLSVFASGAIHGNSQEVPACTSNPRSCGRCGTGVPHSH